MPPMPSRSPRAALGVARSRLAQSRTSVQGASVAQQSRRCWPRSPPSAAPRSRSGHMRIVAPVDGVVAQRTRPARPAGRRRHAADGGGAARSAVDRRQLPRNPAAPPARRPAGRRSRPTSMAATSSITAACSGSRRGQRQRLRAAAAAECLGQLDQDRPARAGAHRARSGANWRRIRCASACRSAPRWTSRDRSGTLVARPAAPPRCGMADARRRGPAGRGAHPPASSPPTRPPPVSAAGEAAAARPARRRWPAARWRSPPWRWRSAPSCRCSTRTIANVSLPTIAGNLGESTDTGTWVITSFAVANGIARAADRLADGPLRRGAHLRRLGAAVHHRLVPVRHRLEPRLADRLPRPPGRGSGPMIPGIAGAADRDLPAAEALAGARHLVDDDAGRAGHGADPRRLYLRQLSLGLDLPDQRAGRRVRGVRLLALPRARARRRRASCRSTASGC